MAKIANQGWGSAAECWCAFKEPENGVVLMPEAPPGPQSVASV